MRTKALNWKLLFSAVALLAGSCGQQLDESGEDLGPYAEKMPWAEYMATSAMDTVQGYADAGSCTTQGVRGLSDQLIAEMNCIHPGLMDRIDDANVSLGAAALPYLQNGASAALHRATAGRSKLSINSALRSLAQQWILYRWYTTGACGVALAAHPGQSNHEDGFAFDTSEYASWRTTLAGYNYRWFGSSDVVHFDYTPGGAAAQGVLAFQRLWNRANPKDRIAEDGSFGPATSARIAKSPRAGFANGPSCH